MNKKSKCNGKHLTISDRLYIEQELLQGSSFRSIASVLGKDPTTISKEIRLHCDNTDSYRFKGCHRCKFFKKCNDTILLCSSCEKSEVFCSYNEKLAKDCEKYDPFCCPKLAKPPYVCNGCEKKNYCRESKRIYHAKKAQHEYEKTLTTTRSGINLTPEVIYSQFMATRFRYVEEHSIITLINEFSKQEISICLAEFAINPAKEKRFHERTKSYRYTETNVPTKTLNTL